MSIIRQHGTWVQQALRAYTNRPLDQQLWARVHWIRFKGNSEKTVAQSVKEFFDNPKAMMASAEDKRHRKLFKEALRGKQVSPINTDQNDPNVMRAYEIAKARGKRPYTVAGFVKTAAAVLAIVAVSQLLLNANLPTATMSTAVRSVNLPFRAAPALSTAEGLVNLSYRAAPAVLTALGSVNLSCRAAPAMSTAVDRANLPRLAAPVSTAVGPVNLPCRAAPAVSTAVDQANLLRLAAPAVLTAVGQVNLPCRAAPAVSTAVGQVNLLGLPAPMPSYQPSKTGNALLRELRAAAVPKPGVFAKNSMPGPSYHPSSDVPKPGVFDTRPQNPAPTIHGVVPQNVSILATTRSLSAFGNRTIGVAARAMRQAYSLSSEEIVTLATSAIIGITAMVFPSYIYRIS